jgi:phosphoserine phosphatase
MDFVELPIDAVVFDCDGTLSCIEGIDYLAALKGVEDQIVPLTQAAMSQGSLNLDLYAKRLAIIQPEQIHFTQLAKAYWRERIQGIEQVILQLLRLQKFVYIVSAGMLPGLLPFALQLGVAREYIYAVDVYFDKQGSYVNFDRHSPLVDNQGKYHVIKALTRQHKRIAHIGDGENDYVSNGLVDRFIGFGGVFYRPNLQAKCKYYIRQPAMHTVLPYILTKDEFDQVD